LATSNSLATVIFYGCDCQREGEQEDDQEEEVEGLIECNALRKTLIAVKSQMRDRIFISSVSTSNIPYPGQAHHLPVANRTPHRQLFLAAIATLASKSSYIIIDQD
jgi:hypothetical protein